MSNEQTYHPVEIDVVSDVICPWCFLGKRRLDRALAAFTAQDWTGLQVDVRFRAYLLDLSIPPEGMDRSAYLAEKFSDPERAQGHGESLKAIGAQDGIPFAFERITRTPNSMDAHRLITWAYSAGVQNQVVELIFQRYFLQGQDVGDRSVLLGIANDVGMDISLVMELLDSGRDRDLVMEEVRSAYRLGISGVPTFIFNRRHGVVGAQDPQVLADIIAKLARGEDPSPQQG